MKESIHIRNRNKTLSSIFIAAIIFFASIILYYKSVFSSEPVGIDSFGHLSKISHIRQFGISQWDASWYAGTPFLKFYPPLFYYTAYVLSFLINEIIAVKILCFMSVFLTALGIFLLVKEHTKNKCLGLLSALLFLTVLNTSYYFLSSGNYPFVFALWTLPFGLLFSQKYLENPDKKYLIIFSFILMLSVLIHIFFTLIIVLASLIKCFLYGKFRINSIKKVLILILPGFLLSAVWLLPFLTKSQQLLEPETEYKPSLSHLTGFGYEYIIWGKGAGEIGITLTLFVICIVFYLIELAKIKKLEKSISFYFLLSIVLLLLTLGVLGSFYPPGIESIRFVVPFSVVMCIFIPLILNKIRIKSSLYVIFLSVFFVGYLVNFNLIQENYTMHNYGKSRYGTFQKILSDENFPAESMNTSLYRFGSYSFVFAENMNYIFPKQPQTFGYYEQGILYPDIITFLRKSVWRSNQTVNETKWLLNWFGIKYFEVGGECVNFRNKFDTNLEYELITSGKADDYPYIIYKYKNPEPLVIYARATIFSTKNDVIDTIKNLAGTNNKVIPVFTDEYINIKHEFLILNSTVVRNNPDKIEVYLDKNHDGDVLIVKEFYYPAWKAFEYPSGNEIKIYRAGPNFMMVIPNKISEKIVFLYSNTLYDYLGILISMITSIMFLLWLRR